MQCICFDGDYKITGLHVPLIPKPWGHGTAAHHLF